MPFHRWVRDLPLALSRGRQGSTVVGALLAVLASVALATPTIGTGSPALPTAVVAAPTIGDDGHLIAQQCPGGDAVRDEDSCPTLIYRGATFHTVQISQPTPAEPAAAPAIDETTFVDAYRANPEGRGPPSNA